MKETFGSACHGAGRVLSRAEALRQTKGRAIERELQDQRHVFSRAASGKTLREEFPHVYKDVNMVVDVVQRAGLARKVAKNPANGRGQRMISIPRAPIGLTHQRTNQWPVLSALFRKYECVFMGMPSAKSSPRRRPGSRVF